MGSGGQADMKIWHYEGTGIYSIKSGYWLGCQMIPKSNPSTSSSVKSWWSRLWKIDMPLKIKNFIWKACQEWIPTMSNLERRGLKVSRLCPRCRRSAESTLHALWDCHKLRYVRLDWLPKKVVFRSCYANVFDFLVKFPLLTSIKMNNLKFF